MDTLYLQNEKAINEIKYFVMFFAIKRLLEQEKITPENFWLANVALAEKYSVLPLYI
ncbi:hypothetical protein [Hominenteromicrobium sp.]|uniref:hypothetical protein n=1 Tax=Hominenteromicrobium sp. TaxID=3073581 RepID=UPI003A900B82